MWKYLSCEYNKTEIGLSVNIIFLWDEHYLLSKAAFPLQNYYSNNDEKDLKEMIISSWNDELQVTQAFYWITFYADN